MIVVKKETSLFKHDSRREDKRPILIGIRCRWFTTTGAMQEAVFNTKDIELIKESSEFSFMFTEVKLLSVPSNSLAIFSFSVE